MLVKIQLPHRGQYSVAADMFGTWIGFELSA
jgi:hypothetical protein